MKSTIVEFCPENQQEWRNWLQQNHEKEAAVWLIMYKKNTADFNLSWSQAVDEALCFGWIDSVKRSIDEEKYQQYFCKRKADSTWSKINKDKVEKLKTAGLIVEAGLKSIEVAKKNGTWNLLDAVEAMQIPDDLSQAFTRNQEALVYFESLSKSYKKGVLYWIISAKRVATREKRISEFIENACLKQLPKQFR